MSLEEAMSLEIRIRSEVERGFALEMASAVMAVGGEIRVPNSLRAEKLILMRLDDDVTQEIVWRALREPVSK
jgi:hypothetical protein